MRWIVGIDEVGRGPLAGPVCVCAVAIPYRQYRLLSKKLGTVPLTDSKQMTAKARQLWERHARALAHKEKLRIGIALRSAVQIDNHGISACIKSCVARALRQLSIDPHECTLLLDGGLKAPEAYIKQKTVIRGDSAHPIISLASVVAKVHRDNLMGKLHTRYPQYGFGKHKGYGTAMHRRAIQQFGPSELHRKSFISKFIEG